MRNNRPFYQFRPVVGWRRIIEMWFRGNRLYHHLSLSCFYWFGHSLCASGCYSYRNSHSTTYTSQEARCHRHHGRLIISTYRTLLCVIYPTDTVIVNKDKLIVERGRGQEACLIFDSFNKGSIFWLGSPFRHKREQQSANLFIFVLTYNVEGILHHHKNHEYTTNKENMK